jgi:hypothetical protein
MGGLSCGSSFVETYDGSQFHRGPRYYDDPLAAATSIFMNNQIPAGFGPLNPPFLTQVTQFTGTGFSSMAAVPTVSLAVPYAVDLLIGNVPQRLFLTEAAPGTSAPSGPGYVIPNDFNIATNNRYWVQLQ